MEKLAHIPIFLNEILEFLPPQQSSLGGKLLDVTAGGGGHFCAILEKCPLWSGVCWDRDVDAQQRVEALLQEKKLTMRAQFVHKKFSEPPADESQKYDVILADLGVSSFQLDDPSRGMSLFSKQAPDFRMNLEQGLPLKEWIAQHSESELADIIYEYGEEPKSRRVARHMKEWGADAFESGEVFAKKIASSLGYTTRSRTHPATRVFQALRIAVNDELGELESLLKWAPNFLSPGGRLMVITFHSLEDRIVKHRFLELAPRGRYEEPSNFGILFKKPLVPTEQEQESNPRSRSAKLRILERRLVTT